MRYAVISDIHGNLEALEAVLESMGKNSIDEILCLGDIVGYGPNPNECVEKMMALGIKSVMGNHDFVMLGGALDYANKDAEQADRWTKSVLTSNNMDYLAHLPMLEMLSGIRLVHSSPVAPGNWDYILDIFDALEAFGSFEEKVCFIGHSHTPAIFNNDGDALERDALAETALSEDQRYIINVGSVGQPRDHDPRACYGILDATLLTFSLVRVQYDVEKVIQKIREAGLPEFLGERLRMGI